MLHYPAVTVVCLKVMKEIQGNFFVKKNLPLTASSFQQNEVLHEDEDFAFSRRGVEFLKRRKFSHEAEKNTKYFQIELTHFKSTYVRKW